MLCVLVGIVGVVVGLAVLWVIGIPFFYLMERKLPWKSDCGWFSIVGGMLTVLGVFVLWAAIPAMHQYGCWILKVIHA